jgi:hypothetical protein
MIGTVGAVAQLGEHLLCKQGVSGSIPLSSTNSIGVELTEDILGENKFASALGPDACSDYIVKRRYVWKLPGVLNDLRSFGTSEPRSEESMDGLADRMWWRVWR